MTVPSGGPFTFPLSVHDVVSFGLAGVGGGNDAFLHRRFAFRLLASTRLHHRCVERNVIRLE